MVGWLLACSLDRFLLAVFGLFCLLILICFAWLPCEARAVEHQKLNQMTPLLGFALLARLLPSLVCLAYWTCFSLLCLLYFLCIK